MLLRAGRSPARDDVVQCKDDALRNMYEFLHAQLNYAIMHVETYHKGELKREFLKKGIPFWGGIQKEEGGAIFL